MQRAFRYLIIATVVAVFLAFMVTYTVRFTEKAVVTTFGRADEGSVKDTPGLRFKLPFVQQVTKYDSRTRVVESNQETQQTFDDRQILVTAFLTWEVEDPLKFFRAFSGTGASARDHYRAAGDILNAKLRSGMSEVSRYPLSDLLSVTEGGSKLAELEQNILATMKSSAGTAAAGATDAAGTQSLDHYGIRLKGVGISRLGLPQATTTVVFDRMNKEREKIANEAINRGKATADSIRNDADAAAQKITDFATALAERIRTKGDQEAAPFIATMDAEPELAVFMETMDLMRRSYGRSTTLVFPTSMPGFELFRPDAMQKARASLLDGKAPSPDLSRFARSTAPAPVPTPAETAPVARPASAPTGEATPATPENGTIGPIIRGAPK